MKILVVHDNGYIIGGAEVIVKNIVDDLENRGHIVRVFSSEIPQNASGAFADYTFKAVNHKSPSRLFLWLGNPSAYFAMKRAIRDFKPDLIFFNSFEEASPMTMLAIGGTPATILVHNYSFLFSPKMNPDFPDSGYTIKSKLNYIFRYCWEYIRFGIVRISIRQIKLVMLHSNYQKEIIDNSILNVDTKKINMGVNLLKKSGLPFTNTILYLGRLSPEKGVDYLVKAMPIVLKECPSAKLVIAGGGPEEDNLRKIVGRLNLKVSSIKFVGNISHDRIAEYYSKSDVVVIPSTWQEPFGVVGLEAMGVGRPVIASRVGGIPEWLIDGETGYLTNKKSSKEIAESILKILMNRELAERMSISARTQAERFTVDLYIDQIEALLNDLLRKNSTGLS